MRHAPLLAFMAALLPVAAGFAASPELPVEDSAAWTGRATELLSKRTDADSLAADELLSVFQQRDDFLRLITQATLKAPQRADLAWLHVQVCQAVTTCDPAALEGRLRPYSFLGLPAFSKT